MRKRKQTTAEREERVVSRAVDRVQCDTTRNDRIIAAFRKANAECPAVAGVVVTVTVAL
jgi:hypothetical protein